MRKILIWSDSAAAATGYGKITREIFAAVYKSGGFEIDHLAINYFGEFYDRSEIPWQMSPAGLIDRSDPHGRKMFIEAISRKHYDLIWIMNDYQVVASTLNDLNTLRLKQKNQSSPLTKFIYYCPIDVTLPKSNTKYFDIFDLVATYSQFGKKQIGNVSPATEARVKVINPGIDIRHIKPLSGDERKKIRKEYFNIPDDDTFLIINVNKNIYRKQIPQSILAFSELKKLNANAKLYLHTSFIDPTSGIDLSVACTVLGLSPIDDVIYPLEAGFKKSFSVEELNKIYNAADCFLTTSLGEGWGLTHMDAMAAGVPVVAPNNTCFHEQLGGGERGILYPCPEKIWIDNAGYRPYARASDICDALMAVHKMNKEDKKIMLANAKTYTESLAWEKIQSLWINEIKKVLAY